MGAIIELGYFYNPQVAHIKGLCETEANDGRCLEPA